MALHESALEELGLAPMWVRRGMGQANAGAAEEAAVALEAVPDGAAVRAEGTAPAQGLVGQGPAHDAGQARPATGRREDAFEQGARAPAARAEEAREFAAPVDRAAARPTQPTRPAPAEPSASSPPPDDDFAWFDDLPSQPPSEASIVAAERAERTEPALQTLDWYSKYSYAVARLLTDPNFEVRTMALYSDRMVGLAAPGHPLASGPVTLERLVSFPQVVVSRRGRDRGPLDDVLAEAGLSRRVAVIVPTHAAAAFLVLSAGLTGIIAGFAARQLSSATDVRAYEIPASLPPLPISAGWHARYDADPEHRWLRSQLQDIASEVAGTAESSARVQSR